MRVALETGLIAGFAAQAFPVEFDARKLFVIEGGNFDVHFAAAVKINGVGHGERGLATEESRQYFGRFGVVFEFGFDVGADGSKAAGKRAVFDVVDDGNRFLQYGFQVVGQEFFGILQQGRFQSDDGGFRGTEPAAFVGVGFDGQKTGFLQQFLLLGQRFFCFDAQIVGGGRHACNEYGYGRDEEFCQ